MVRRLFLLSFIIAVLLFFNLVVLVEADYEGWIQSYGETGLESASDLIETSDGGFAIAGYKSLGGGEYDFILIKADWAGNIEWDRAYNRTRYDRAESLVETSDGGYAIAGYVGRPGTEDFWLIKTDQFGNMEWNQTYGGTETEHASSLVATSDGGYAIAGGTSSFGSGQQDCWLIKTDEFGNMEWNKTYGGEVADYAWSLIVTSDGGFAIAAITESFGAGFLDFWLVKTDEFGNMEWNRTYGGPGFDHAYSLVETSDGGYVIVGNKENSTVEPEPTPLPPLPSDVWLVKTDAEGNMEWNETYGATYDVAYSLVHTSDGGYAIAGTTGIIPEENSLLVKIDAFGNLEWMQTYEGITSVVSHSLIETSDGGFAIAGGALLIKTDGLGVVPEYSSWLIPTLLMATTVIIIVYKRDRISNCK